MSVCKKCGGNFLDDLGVCETCGYDGTDSDNTMINNLENANSDIYESQDELQKKMADLAALFSEVDFSPIEDDNKELDVLDVDKIIMGLNIPRFESVKKDTTVKKEKIEKKKKKLSFRKSKKEKKVKEFEKNNSTEEHKIDIEDNVDYDITDDDNLYAKSKLNEENSDTYNITDINKGLTNKSNIVDDDSMNNSENLVKDENLIGNETNSDSDNEEDIIKESQPDIGLLSDIDKILGDAEENPNSDEIKYSTATLGVDDGDEDFEDEALDGIIGDKPSIKSDKQKKTDINTDEKESISDSHLDTEKAKKQSVFSFLKNKFSKHNNVDMKGLDSSDETVKVSSDESLAEEESCGHLLKLIHKIFGNVEDARYEAKMKKLDEHEMDKLKKKREKEKINKEKKEAKKNSATNEDKGAKEQEKKRLKTEQAEKKRKRQDARKRKMLADEEKEPKTRINKLGATVVFSFFALIVFTILAGVNKLSYDESINRAKEYYDNGDYCNAYTEIAGLNVKDKDSKLYQRIRVLQTLNNQLSYCDSYIIINKYPEALDALIGAINLYDLDSKTAEQLSVSEQYEKIFSRASKILTDTYGISVDDARSISLINDKHEYTDRIKSICDGLEYTKDENNSDAES